MKDPTGSTQILCPICKFSTDHPRPEELGRVRGNTERFHTTAFQLWKCPKCETIVSLDRVDFHDIYRDYPLNHRQLDVFARSTLKNLLGRLQHAGMKKSDAILDYGCGNNIFVDYLKQQGYEHAEGYDPYVPEFSNRPTQLETFDVVVNNDTVEHCEDIHAMIRECLDLLKPGGLLYVGTADSKPVVMSNLEPHMMRLHQPYHRIIITEKSLHEIVSLYDVEVVGAYTRSYHDTKRPFANYRFLDELNKALGHNLDKAMNPRETTAAFLRTPRLWFFALFGYWFPSAVEPAIVVRKRQQV